MLVNKLRYNDPFHEKQIELLFELQDLLDKNYDSEYIRNVFIDMSRSLYSDESDDHFRYDLMTFSVSDICGTRKTELEPGICLSDVYVSIPCKDPHHVGINTTLVAHLGGVNCLSCYKSTVADIGLIYPTE